VPSLRSKEGVQPWALPDSFPTPIWRPTPVMTPRFTSVLMARKSYPRFVRRNPLSAPRGTHHAG